MIDDLRLECERLDCEAELRLATECLCDALTMISFLRPRSARIVRHESLTAELEAMREDLARYQVSRMS